MKHYTLKKGKKLKKSFDTASDGGYAWRISEKTKGVKVHKKGIKTVSPKSDDAVGNNTKTIFELSAEKSGNYEIVFEHIRPWEDEAIERVKIRLTVK